MAAKQPDMFSSDPHFVMAVSGFLLVSGGGMLIFVLLCRLIGLDVCSLDWIPLFGGFDVFREDLAAINLPLAMLILGIGLRLFTPFGWITCTVLLGILTTGFCILAYRLSQELDAYWQSAIEQPSLVQDHPLVESIITNLGLALLSLLLTIYLLSPNVRRLFWFKHQTQA